MLVYRVELDDRLGPYTSNSKNRKHELVIRHQNFDSHPLVDIDCFGRMWEIDENYFCGFETLKRYNDWFGDAIDLLQQMKARLKTYEVSVDHVKFSKSGRQLCFRRDKATLVEDNEI